MVVSTAVSKFLKFKDGKYEVAIPWKDERTRPKNYIAAFKRLENTGKRLLGQPKLKILQKHGKLYQQGISRICRC